MFNSEVDHYQNALNNAGYNVKLEFKNEQRSDKQGKKRRCRNVIWFNPPYSQNVRTNIAGKFISLLRKHFPPNSELYKIFNVKKVKVAYSCCPSMQKIISAHNAKLLRPNKNQTNAEKRCNCENGIGECPLNGNCLVENIVYKARVSSQLETKEYIGQTQNTFKERYGNLKNSFKKSYKRGSTKLAGYVWDLKDSGIIDPDIEWSILRKSLPYQGGGGMCHLCIDEKTFICSSNPDITLNRRTEIMQKCNHKLPFYLNNYHGLRIPRAQQTEEEGCVEEDLSAGRLPAIPEEDSEIEEDSSQTEEVLLQSVEGQDEEEGLSVIGGQLEEDSSTVGRPEEEESLLGEDSLVVIAASPQVDGILTRRRTKNLRNYKFFKL